MSIVEYMPLLAITASALIAVSRVQLVLATLGVDRCGGWGLAVVANITDSGELMG